MAQLTINVGAVPNDNTGDALRDGFIKVNSNFTELYAAGGAGTGDALVANPLSQFAATTSLQLAGVLSDKTGTGLLVFNTSPTLVTPLLGTPTSGNLLNCIFPVLNQNTTGTAALATNIAGGLGGQVLVQSAAGVTAPVVNGTVGQVLTSAGTTLAPTWTTPAGTGDALIASPLSQFAATTSLQLAGVLSDETGAGSLVFNTSPTLVTPLLGTPTSGNLLNCTVNGTDKIGYLDVPANAKSVAYTLLLSDAGKAVDHPATDAVARTFTIPANATVAYPIGTTVTFTNMAPQPVTIAITTDTMYLAGVGTTGNRTLAQFGMATARKLTATTWVIAGTGLT